MTSDTSIEQLQLKFGYFLVPNEDDQLIETAKRVEALGLDYVGIQDHPYQRRYVDTWMLMAFIAAHTSTLRIFPDVANLPLRHPPIIAKAAMTIGKLSDGRFDLGLGAGAFWDAIEAYGGEKRGPGESLRALEEAISVIRMIWSGEGNLQFRGDHYHLAGARGGPVPTAPIGIWLGAYGPKALDLTARVADGWVPSFQGDVAPIAQMSDRLDEALDSAGRARSELRRVMNISGEITDSPSRGPLHGPVDQWVDQLWEFATVYGFDTFLLWNEDPRQLERFAKEVVPALRVP